MNLAWVILPFLFAGMFALLYLLREPVDEFLHRAPSREGIYQRIATVLRRAGVRVAPGVFLAAVLTIMLLLIAVVFIITTSPLTALTFAPIVIAGAYAWVRIRERSFLDRATSEIVPFLRRLEAQVRAGRNAQAAFVDALSESDLLSRRMEALSADLALGRPFQEVLRASTDAIPLRSWAQFVRQMELYQEGGGDLAEILSSSVAQINAVIQLQAELRADYARVARQQWVIVGLAIATIPLLALAGLLDRLLTTPAGIIALVIGVALIVIGVLWGRAQVKDIERRLAF